MNRRGALLAVALLLAVLLAAPAAYAQTPPAQGPCLAMDELNLYDPDRPGELFTTPPYVALAASRSLRRLGRRSRPLRREVALSDEQSACLEALTGARMTAVRAGTSYRYKLQTDVGTLFIFHVDHLVGSEVLTPTEAERLLANAERFLKEGNCTEAAKAYREALKAEPRPAEATRAHTALGKIEAEEGPCKAVEAPLPAQEEQAPLQALEEQAPLPAMEEQARGLYKAIFDRINPVTAMLAIRLALMGLIFLTLSYSFIYRRVREGRRKLADIQHQLQSAPLAKKSKLLAPIMNASDKIEKIEQKMNILVVIFLFISSSVAYMIPLEWISESLHPGTFFIIGAVSSIWAVATIPYTVTNIPHKQKLIFTWLFLGLVILLTGQSFYYYYAG